MAHNTRGRGRQLVVAHDALVCMFVRCYVAGFGWGQFSVFT